jgi:hypothetical protein
VGRAGEPPSGLRGLLITRAVVGELVRSNWWHHRLFQRNYRIEMVTAYLYGVRLKRSRIIMQPGATSGSW